MALKPFVLNQTDLEFILAQLDFVPLFDANGDAVINWNGTGAVYDTAGQVIWDPAGRTTYSFNGVTLTSANVVDVLGHSFPTSTTLMGLREQTGVHNNLNAGEPTQTWGVSGATFIRLVPANFWDYVSTVDYTPNANVTDATPRMISRTITTGGMVLLEDAGGQIVYWSSDRYAAEPAYKAMIDAWNADPANVANVIDTARQIDGAAVVIDRGIVGQIGQIDFQNPDNAEVFVGSQNPGVAPTNGWFALFGQFFDHGLDFIDKSSAYGKITIPLSVDDPLYRAPGTNGPADPGNTKITVSRAVIAGTDANGDPTYVNHTSPYIDQNQTYGSSEVISDILREWVVDPVTGDWVPGMKLLDGDSLVDAWTDGWGNQTHATLPTLAELNDHLIATGRDPLNWGDVTNLRNRDASGHVVAGNTGHPLLLDMNPKFDTAHFSAATEAGLAGTFVKFDPVNNRMVVTTSGDPAGHAILPGADGSYSTTDLSAIINFASFQPMQANNTPVGALAAQLLFDSVSAHYIAGDGRVNENFGLTAVHHVFHSEHNYQVQNLLQALAKQDAALFASGDTSHATLHGFQVDTGTTDAAGNFIHGDGSIAWDQDKVFLGTKLIVEMEYQHTAADQFAPTITPDIPEFVGYNSGVNASISLEFGQVAYRFGHSTLRETIDTIDPNGSITGKIVSYALQMAFLNPDKYAEIGPGAITQGMTHQQAGDVDEFMTPALNQGLLGMPLDLAAINIARGRDLGIPTLNAMRSALGVQAYDSWASFAEGMGHKESLPAFIAAYAFNGDMAKAQEIVDLANGVITSGTGPMGWTIGNAIAFMNNAFTAADTAVTELVDGAKAVDFIDSWIGGLAEVHVTGGLLGETFNILFVDQIVRLKDGDRLYYLYRLVNQNFGDEIGSEQFKDIVERNTGLQHLNGNIFAYADQYYDFGRDADTATAGIQDDIPNHAYGATLAANPDAGILSRGGAEASNGAVLDYLAPQVHAFSRENVAVDGRNVTFTQAAAVAAKYVLDQRAEHDPTQVNIEGLPVTGAATHEVMVGSVGNDVLYLEAGDDTGYGEGGDDLLIGGGGIDRLHGGAGNDTLIGGDMGDLIDGGDGDDVLVGGSSGTAAAGLNQLVGGQGDDVIYAGQGIDKISGGGGDDLIFGEGDTDPFTHGGDGCDYIDGGQSGDLLYGDNGDDVLVGGDDQDFLQGGLGDDIIRPGNPSQALAGFGPDEVIGGDALTDTGFDLIDFSDYLVGSPAIVADMNTQNNPTIAIDKTTPFPAWFQMEGVIGSQSGDRVIGDANGNWLIGGSGDDRLQGGAGFDVLIGDSIRLDQLIGNYSGDYTKVDDVSGATHRNTGMLQDNGLLGRADLGTVGFDKHFTEMLSSRMFKDYVLGNDGGAASSDDTAVFAGNRADYHVERLTLRPGDPAVGPVWKITGSGDAVDEGSDLLVGIERIVFADGELQLVNTPASGAPVISDTTPTENQNLATNTTGIVDPNGLGAFTYQWKSSLDGITWSNIVGANSASFRPGQALVGQQLQVQVSFTDGMGNLETLVSAGTAAVVDSNVAPTGALTISDTTPQSGQTLFANALGIQDANGFNPLTTPQSFQWQSSVDGVTWTNIAGATGVSFQPGAAQIGLQLRASVTFTDGEATVETVTSAATRAVGNTINGTAAAETLTGTAGDDAISGLLGNDTINAGAGDDTITWNANQTGATDGRDFVDGGAGVDTVVVTTRVLGIETYRIYTRAAAIAAGITPQNANTEIVITRGQAPLVGTTVYTPILELDNIEEIVIGTNNVTAPTNGVPNAGGAGLGDTVQVFGDFSTTSLLLNTITINGTSGADTVDIAALTSAHRIVFRTAGGNDIVVGTLRPQDVIQVPDGVDPAAYVATDNGDGTVTMATGTHSVTFTGSINALPTLAPGGVAPEGNMGDVDAGQHAGDENGSGAESGVSDGNDGASDDRDADADHGGAGLVLMPSETAGVHVGDAGDDVILGGDQGDAQIGKGGADVLIGNGGDDAAVGGSGDDVIEGGAGRDVLLGAAGNDHFIAQSDDGADLIFGGEGSDTLDLSALIDGAVIDLGAYTPIGTVRADGVTDHLIGVENVIGTQGADVIKAALGINILTGDDGDDLFVFVSAGAADGDVITDFRPGDRIDLSGIDAMVGTNGNQAFTLAEMGMTAAGSLVIHEVATADGVDTIIDGYTDADDDADFSLTLHGAHDLSGAFTF